MRWRLPHAFVCWKWEPPEHAAPGREPAERVMEEGCWSRVLEQRRMDSRAQLLGLALKKRRATPPHPGGKEVRGWCEDDMVAAGSG